MIENLTEEQVKELAKIAGGQGTKTVEEVLPECSAEDKEATKKQLELIKDGKDLDAIGGGLSKTAIGAICGAVGAVIGAGAGIGFTILAQKNKNKPTEENPKSSFPHAPEITPPLRRSASYSEMSPVSNLLDD